MSVSVPINRFSSATVRLAVMLLVLISSFSQRVFAQTPPPVPASKAPALTAEQQKQLEKATELCDKAFQSWKKGQYAKGIPLLLEACEIRKKVLGEQHPDHAKALNDLAYAYYLVGEYAKAEPILIRVCKIRRHFQGAEYLNLGESLNCLALLYHAKGQYGKAEKHFLQSIDIYVQSDGKKHPGYSSSMNNLALLYIDMGEYAKAKSLLIQVIEIRKSQLGEQHPKVAVALNNLALLYDSTKEFAKAEPLYLQSLAIHKKVFGEEHPKYITVLSNLAALYISMGEYAKAEPLLLNCLVFDKKVLGDQHLNYACDLTKLAQLYETMGEYTKAEPVQIQALNIVGKALGKQHHHYVLILDELAELYCSMGEFAKSADYCQQSAKIKYSLATMILPAISEAQALNYAKKELRPPNRLISVWRHTTGSDDDLYACIWKFRGLIQQITSSRQQQLHQSSRPEINRSYEEYQETRRTLAKLILSSSGIAPKELAARRERLEQLTQKKERLERELASALPEFRRLFDAQHRTHTELASKLPPDTVFIDFLQYQHIEQDPQINGFRGERKTKMYSSFIISAGSPVAMVNLGPAKPIDEAISRWQEEVASGNPECASAELRKLLWEPLEKQLPSDTKTVYLCPYGKMAFLPWAALPGKKNGTVLLEDYALAIVPYGQLLLEQLNHTPSQSTDENGLMLAVGGVKYDDKPTDTNAKQTGQLAMRDAARGDKQLHWPPLPGTKRELETIARLAGEQTIVELTGSSADTSAIFGKLPEARWAHFATHGFFADPKFRSILQVDERSSGRPNAVSSEYRTAADRNPLVLSGIVLAGANLPRDKDEYGIPRGDGGILTAEAIASLPLEKLELAVLSACETGLGDVAGGEGVYGLQRAFHQAGARNVVASLWKVDDNATAALMCIFYHKLWKEHLPPIEALSQAQLAIYRHPELIGKLSASRGLAFDRPLDLPYGGQVAPGSPTAATKQWAAFILSGSGR